MDQLTTTDATAIYAAIVATGALALEIRRWFESGPKLYLTIMSQAQLFGTGQQDESEYLAARVTNRGDRPTTITSYGLHQYKSPFHRWLNRSSKSAIVPRPEFLADTLYPTFFNQVRSGAAWQNMTPG
jgi:hypothetical protein